MLFDLDIPFILNEIKSKKELRKYFNISEVLSATQVYKIFSLYIGFKATVVIDFDSMNPVCILIHSGALNDVKLLIKIWKHFKKDE